MKMNGLLKLGLFACFAQASVFAQETDIELRGEIDTESNKSIVDDISVFYFSQSYGPNVDKMESSLNNDSGEPSSDRISSWNQISVRYPITSEIDFIVNPRFLLGNGEGIEALDPVIGVQSVWYQEGDFAFFSTIETEIPLSQDARDDGELLSPGAFMDASYRVSDKMLIGSWASFRFSNFENNDGRQRIGAYFAPYIQYQLADNLQFRTFYEASYDQMATKELYDFEFADSNLLVGVAWDATKEWNIYPYFIFSPNGDVSVESTTLGMMVSGRLF